MVDLANTVWRDFATAGIPASGRKKPEKSKIREWGTYIESLTMAANYGNTVWFSTKALLNADLDHDAGTPAVVYADTTAANNGIYIKSGASGAGSWSQIITYLPGYQFVTATDAGAGSANAIVATSSPLVAYTDGVQLIRLNIYETNTSGTVTVAFNGGAALAIKTVSGSNPAVGALTGGMTVIGVVDASATQFRLISELSNQANFDHQGDWSGATTYTENQVVTGSDGYWYQLKVASSLNDNPVSGGSGDWLEILSETGVADGSITTVKLAADAVTGEKIADDEIDDDHIKTPSILRTRILNELWFNEPTFGAPADDVSGGATNAASAFQDMVDAANGRPMFLPPRTYPIMIGTEIELNRQTTTSGMDNEAPIIKGAGAYRSKILARVSSGAVFKHTQNVAYAYATMPLFEDFWIYGDGSTPSGCNGFEINGLGSPTFNRVKISALTGSGIVAPFDGAFSNGDEMGNLFLMLNNVHILNCEGWGVELLDGATAMMARDCYVVGNDHGGYDVHGSSAGLISGGAVAYNGNSTYAAAGICAGIRIKENTSYATSPHNWIVERCEIDRNHYNNVRLKEAYLCKLWHNRIIDEATTGTPFLSDRQIDLIGCGVGENVIERNHFRLQRVSGSSTTIGVYTPSGTNHTYVLRNYFSYSDGVTDHSDGGTNNAKVTFGATF